MASSYRNAGDSDIRSVLHVSDPHIGMTGIRADDVFDRLVDSLTWIEPLPDIMLITGDLTERGKPEEYRLLAELVGSLPVSVRVLPGNHDQIPNLLASPVASLLGANRLHSETSAWWEDFDSFRLVGLDSSVSDQVGGRLGTTQSKWLTDVVADAIGPVLVGLHHPPIPVGLAAIDRVGLSAPEELTPCLKIGRVQAILTGHVHRSVTAAFAGVPVYVASSMAWRSTTDFSDRRRLMESPEPPSGWLHRWDAIHGFISHQVSLAMERIRRSSDRIARYTSHPEEGEQR